MERQELENRLRSFEILSFVNDTDVFEFSFSKLRGGFKVMRNGSLLNKRFTFQNIVMMIKMRDLQFEEF
tara:strand:+ start:227 stop:433 length:207 start_codon:yes stop_codon:yes gene_type:complete